MPPRPQEGGRILKPTRIFIDLDDVLNEFTMTTLRNLGCDIVDYDPEWGWDIVLAYNCTHPRHHLTAGSFWDSFGCDHWATLPKSGMCDLLIMRCADFVGRENVCVLSCPTEDPDCLAGKLEWIHSNLPEWIHRQYMIGPQKHLCASPESLLIDDCDKNIKDFAMAGGKTILVPRPWNCQNNLPNPTRQVFSRLDHFFLHETEE